MVFRPLARFVIVFTFKSGGSLRKTQPSILKVMNTKLYFNYVYKAQETKLVLYASGNYSGSRTFGVKNYFNGCDRLCCSGQVEPLPFFLLLPQILGVYILVALGAFDEVLEKEFCICSSVQYRGFVCCTRELFRLLQLFTCVSILTRNLRVSSVESLDPSIFFVHFNFNFHSVWSK